MSELADHLQQYMINRITIDLVPEWGYQYDRWKSFLENTVSPAFADAFKSQQETLKASEKAKEALWDLAKIGLSIIGQVTLSWVAGKIQYEYLAKYNPTIKFKTVKVDANYKVSLSGQYVEYDKVAGKVCADMSKELGKIGLGEVTKSVPINSVSPADGSGVAKAGDPDQFKREIGDELNSQKKMLTATIGDFADKILDSKLDWGGEQVKRLLKKYPELLKLPEQEQRRRGESMLNDDLDKMRNSWADNPVWFYFGYVPFSYSRFELARTIERELWALWVLDQDYKVEHKTMRYRGELYDSDVVAGKNVMNRPIWDRLVELHVFKAPPLVDEQSIPPNPDSDPNDEENQAMEVPYNWDTSFLPMLLSWANSHGTTPQSQMKGVSRILGSITGVHQSILQGH
jgi:hypothetical protein